LHRGEQIGKHRKWPVGDSEQIGKRAAEDGIRDCADEPQLAPLTIIDQASFGESTRLVVNRVEAGVDRVGCFGKTVFAVGVEVEEREKVSGDLRTQEGQERWR